MLSLRCCPDVRAIHSCGPTRNLSALAFSAVKLARLARSCGKFSSVLLTCDAGGNQLG